MFQLPRILKNFNLYVDGLGYAGRIDRATPPAMALVMEDHRAGGMDGTKRLEMGMEAMTFAATVSDYGPELRNQFGLDGLQMQLRGTVQAQGVKSEAVLITMRGQIVKIEDSEWGGNTKTAVNITFELDYFKYRQKDVEHIEIDIINMVRRFGDVDQLESQRADIGLA